MSEKYSCEAQQRLLRVVEILVGNEVNGLAVKDIGERSGSTAATVYRDLMNLREAGWSEQLEDGRWRISVNAAKMLRRINDGINSALARVNAARRMYQDE